MSLTASPTVSGLPADQLMAAALNSSPVSSPAFAWVPPSVEDAARWFPDYELQALAGRGAMGAVYRAVQWKLDRPVAIKLLPAELAASDGVEARFQREARALARLNHPGIVALHDFGRTSSGHLFIVMEFVDGTDLGRLIHAEGGLGVAQALEIVGQVCDALQYAHGCGFVHRDIKPGNVLVDRNGRVKIADFGLAKLVAGAADNGIPDHRATLTGQALGTPDYTAPEQLKGGPVDHRADIYSLGVMFYEMLTGELPRGAWPPPSTCTAAPVRLDEVVTRAMQTEPDRRYQQASEVKAAATATETPAPRPAATYSSVNRVMVRLMFAFIVASAMITPTGDALTMVMLAAPFIVLAAWFKLKRRPAGLVSVLLAGMAMGAALLVGVLHYDRLADREKQGRGDDSRIDDEHAARTREAEAKLNALLVDYDEKHPRVQAARAELEALGSGTRKSAARDGIVSFPVTQVSPAQDGRLEKMNVNTGQDVAAGQELVVMDSTRVRLDLAALQRSIVDRLKKEIRDSDVEVLKLESELRALEMSVAEDSAVVKTANAQFKDAQEQLAGTLNVEKARARLAAAAGQRSIIEQSLAHLRSLRQDPEKAIKALQPLELTDTKIVPLLPLTADEQNRREELLQKLSECQLLSPRAGKVGRIGKEPGEFVRAGEVILTIE